MTRTSDVFHSAYSNSLRMIPFPCRPLGTAVRLSHALRPNRAGIGVTCRSNAKVSCRISPISNMAYGVDTRGDLQPLPASHGRSENDLLSRIGVALPSTILTAPPFRYSLGEDRALNLDKAVRRLTHSEGHQGHSPAELRASALTKISLLLRYYSVVQSTPLR